MPVAPSMVQRRLHMKSTYSVKKIGTGILALSFLLLIGAGTMSAQSQDRYGRRDDRYYEQQRRDRDDYQRRRRDRRGGRYGDGYSDFGGSLQLRQTALNAGANEGNKE